MVHITETDNRSLESRNIQYLHIRMNVNLLKNSGKPQENRFIDRKIHTSYLWGIQQSVKILYILLEMSYKVYKVNFYVNFEFVSCQNCKLPKLKVAKVESEFIILLVFLMK